MHHLKDSSQQNAEGKATPTVDCAADPIISLKTMFVGMVQGRRIAKGQCPALRPVFLKLHGVAAAQFNIRADHAFWLRRHV